MPFTYDTPILWCVPTMVINILTHNIFITFSEVLAKVYNIGCFYFWRLHKKAWNLKICLVYSGLRVKDVVLLSLYSSSKSKHFLPIRNSDVLWYEPNCKIIISIFGKNTINYNIWDIFDPQKMLYMELRIS